MNSFSIICRVLWAVADCVKLGNWGFGGLDLRRGKRRSDFVQDDYEEKHGYVVIVVLVAAGTGGFLRHP